MASEIRVPTMGESVTEATVGQWLKSAGDAVKADEPLVELETDKVAQEVLAPVDGILAEIVASDGDTVEVGALLGTITEDGAAKPAAAASKKQPASSDPKPTPSGSAPVDIAVPSAGESVTEAEVGEWFKKVGDPVAVDEPLVELETDKAAQDVLSPVAGVLAEVLAKTGDTVEVGALLAKVDPSGTPATAPAEASPTAAKPSDAGMPPSVAAQKMMTENKVDAASVSGSGKRGQILKEDVINKLAEGAAAPAVADPVPVAARPASEGEREERVKMTRLRQTIARRLKDAQNTAAMLTTFNEVDMTAVMALRKKYKDLFEKKHGIKLGFMGVFTKAVCHALQEIPAINAEIDGADLVYKHYCHVGVAVGTDKGLVVPVVRDADQMSIAEIEQEIGNLGRKARDGSLSVSDMQGGTFTISNGGVYGSLMSTPILNAPQSGILGMHKIQERPMVVDGEIKIRPMMYLALSYDHRIVDGKEAVTFLVRVKESLEDPERLVLDL